MGSGTWLSPSQVSANIMRIEKYGNSVRSRNCSIPESRRLFQAVHGKQFAGTFGFGAMDLAVCQHVRPL